MEYSPPPLFKQGPSARVRLAFFVVLSVGLLFLDSRYQAMEVVRQVVGTALYPLQRIASAPVQWIQDGSRYISSLDQLQSEKELLIREQILDKQKLHELQTLKLENEKLRKLMNVGATLKVKRSILSEVISDARDPFSRKIILGKGLIQGVKEGMPVIDELGLLGQVTRAFPSRSEVSLITDKEQIVPVESLRNGIRSVAYGGLDGGLLELRFMAANADIENGDLLVTSGLDGVYPRGVPVARVVRVERNSRYAFASIFCEPIAGVDRHRFVLVLDTFRDSEEIAPAPALETNPTQGNHNGLIPVTPPATTPAKSGPSPASAVSPVKQGAGSGN
jgi:rod shape-determining protein MreC